MVGFLLLFTLLLTLLILTLLFTVIKSRRRRNHAVGFFHPYTNDGGGGERVLWCAVKGIQELSPNLDCVVYTGDHDASPESLTARALDRFGVQLVKSPKVVHLYKRKWIEDTTYPRFTMIGQSLGSIYLSWEALCKLVPVYYFDTSGYAFTYPVARIFGCKVICYMHYPTISLDMLSRVNARTSMYNNDPLVAKSSIAALFISVLLLKRETSVSPFTLMLLVGGLVSHAGRSDEFLCYITPNPAWPPPSLLLPGLPERVKDLSVKSWSSIAGSGPVPWRQAPSLFNPELHPKMPLEFNMPTGIDKLLGSKKLSDSSVDKKGKSGLFWKTNKWKPEGWCFTYIREWKQV